MLVYGLFLPAEITLFFMAFNLFETPKLTKPVQVYDPTKSVQENMSGQGNPTAANIRTAYQTATAQQQMQHRPSADAGGVVAKTAPVVDPNSPTSGMDAVIANMYTSPEQEEKMRRASVANQRILAIGDALRHIGNIYNTVNGAPSQQFNNPVQEEYARYQQGKAVRDAANARYFSYQQAKAAQDAKAKQWEEEQGYKKAMLTHYQDQDRRLWARDVDNAAYHEGLLGLRKEKQKLDEDYRNKRISLDEYNARSRRISAMASAARAGRSGGSGGKGMDEYTTTTETVYNYDKYGKRTGTSTTKRRMVNGKAQPTQTTKKKTLPGNTPAKSKSGKKRLPGT